MTTENRSRTPVIGFIGLGNMGANMARCLQRAGYPLVVHDLNVSAGEELVDHGAIWSQSAADCAGRCDILITSLPRPDDVRIVMAGTTGALAALPDGTVWVDMTTNDSQLVKELAEIAGQRSIAVVDAPVTGAIDGAIRGRLTIFAGGASDTLDQVQPVLETMGRVIRCGELGTGNVVKLVTNYLWFTHAAVIGEGLLLGKQAGVSLDILWEAIKNSVGDSFVARHDAPSIFAGHYDPSFSLALCLKDLGLCRALAQRHGVPTPVGDTVSERFHQAAASYGEQSGEMHVAKLLEDAVGSELRLDGDFRPHWEA